MSKILTLPSNEFEIEKTKNKVDGFIIGIKDMCVNTNMCIGIDNLDILNDLKGKDIFININKNMQNSDLEKIKEILIKLNNYNIKAVMYYDYAVLNIYKSLKLNYDLVWHAEHAVNNYDTINYFNSMGVNFAYLSSDITEYEITQIKNNTKVKLIATMFGYLPMFVSKRHIVKNYLDYFKLSDNSKINYIKKEGKIYPIIDSNIGTSVYSSNILNGIESVINLDLDYIVLNSFNIEEEKFINIINMFKTVNKNNVLEYKEKIDNMFLNVDDGFLNTETIYRVKK